MSLKDVLKQRRSEIFKIADQYGVHNIRIFGSVGKETERPDSDVDFLVDLEKGSKFHIVPAPGPKWHSRLHGNNGMKLK